MSYFAKVFDGKVVRVIVAEADFFDTYIDPNPGEWIRTDFYTRGNIHYGPDDQPDGGTPLRGNFAGIGYAYDKVNDVFIPKSPYPSWVLNTERWLWDPPIPYPPDSDFYEWDEATKSWIVIPPN